MSSNDLDNEYYEYDDLYDDEYLWNERLYSEFNQQSRPTQNIFDLFTNCIIPVLSDGGVVAAKILFLCVILRVTASIAKLPLWAVHITSCCLGIICLYQLFEYSGIYVIVLSVLSYVVLIISQRWQQRGLLLSIFCVAFLLSCELFIVEAKEWHRIRGLQMVLAMKVISLGFDLDKDNDAKLPNVIEYAGYTLCVGTLIFGPWISYDDYLTVAKRSQFSLRWLCKIILSIVFSFFFLSVSTCWSSWIISDNSHEWLQVYRDALSFRTSHYFVTFLSQATVLTAGIDSRDSSVSKPQFIEIPRSMVEVVVNWHVPMHRWLKNYVFKVARPLGMFAAVLLTYASSALLHGINFQLSSVLLSLGFFSYTEHVLRRKLAATFSMCIQSRPCKPECRHHYIWKHPLTIIVNIGFGILTIFNLAYLGVMFNGSSQLEEQGYGMQHTLSKWSELNFVSHWIMVGMFSIAYLL
ncbi:PORCN (predicted) [Pycnogonum litorale]